MNPKHLSKSPLWYTPVWLIEKCRELLGPIDFDPASDEFGDSRVDATVYWEANALGREWPKVKTVFLNPPGGKIGGRRSQAALFWHKFMSEWAAGKFEHGIFIAFNTEILQVAQAEIPDVPPQAFPFCVPKKRFGYDRDRLVDPDRPTHASMIVYVPKLGKVGQRRYRFGQMCCQAADTYKPCACEATEKFKTVFAGVGYVRV